MASAVDSRHRRRTIGKPAAGRRESRDDAVTLIKRTCSHASKRYHPLRSTGVASFIAALARSGEAVQGA
jgi:hypothetical protein